MTGNSPSDQLVELESDDCSEGCDHPSGHHKWEIEPHPYGTDFDTFVSDDDQLTLEALHRVVENQWDEMSPGDEVVIKVRMNKA